jgi:hypothetical protein
VKTISLKKVAVVAVASLGFGLLSVVPAYAGTAGTATAIAVSYTTEDDGVDLAVGKYVSNPIRDAQQISAFTVAAGSSVELELTSVGGTFTTDDRIKVEMAGYGLVVASHAAAATASGAEDVLPAFDAPTVAGTYTLNVTLAKNGTYAAATDLTTSVTMTVTKAAFSAGRSTSILDNTDNTGNATADEVVRVSSAIGTFGGQIYGELKDSAGAAYNGLKVRAEITGVGLVNAIAGGIGAAAAGTGRTDDVTLTGNTFYVDISADGQAGTGTVTVSVIDPSTGASLGVIGTHTVNFYSTTVATLVATAMSSVAKAGATLGCSSATTCDQATYADTPFISVVAKDSKGNLLPGLALTFTSSDTSVIASATTNAVTSEASDTTACVSTDCLGQGYYNSAITGAGGAKSGSTAKVTYSVTLANGTVIKSNEITLSIGGAVASTALALDKASYVAGESMIMTFTAKDSSGNAPYDGQSIIAAASTLAASKSVGGSLPTTSNYFTAGKYATKANKVFAPVIAGAFSVNGTGNDAAGTAFSVSAAVTDANAGLLTQIDALNAKIVALNALIAKIMKKLGVK